MVKISDFPGQPKDDFERMVLECFQPWASDGKVTIGEFAGRLRPLFKQAVRDAIKNQEVEDG